MATIGAKAIMAPSSLTKEARVAVLFYRLGPYHVARLKGAASRLKVAAVEFSDVDPTYAWDAVEGREGFERSVLFSGTPVESQSASQIFEAVDKAMNELRPAVVAIPGWSERCSLAALKWCLIYAVPAIVMSDTTAWDEKRYWWKEWAKGRVAQLCSAGLVGGHVHAQYLEQLGVAREKIFLGYDVVDNDYFADKAQKVRSQKSEVRSQLGLPERYFLASARFVEKKNLPRLIRAYALYRKKSEVRSQSSDLRLPTSAPWDLVLLGDGPLKSDLCHLISDLGLQDSVLLPGFKQYNELPAYYALAGVFVHASTTEQWGLVVNEAMASGLPVLVSNRCGCAADLVREGKNGFTFNPANEKELTRLMMLMSGGSVNMEAMGWESRRIIKDWSPERFAENLEAACLSAVTNYQAKRNYVARGITDLLIRLPEIGIKRRNERVECSSSSRKAHLPAVTVTPNFFVIGAPKSGTTSLCEYLKGHPNVYFSSVKEPHFFDLDSSKRFKLSLRIYLSLFSKADPELHKAVGEGSTGYLFSKEAVSEILKFNPNARFIVILRNPVELVQAWHSEMYFEGVEDVKAFEAAWKLEGVRRQGNEVPSHCWEPRKLFYSEWGKLGDQIERLFSVAARESVKVIVFDDFVADTKRVYEEVLAFLGVPSDGRSDFPQINENRSLKHPGLQRTFAFFANHYRLLRAVSGLNLNLGLGLFPKLLLLNSEQSPRTPTSPAMRAELNDFYREDVQKLSKLLGRDLSYWVSTPPNQLVSDPFRNQ